LYLDHDKQLFNVFIDKIHHLLYSLAIGEINKQHTRVLADRILILQQLLSPEIDI
jgi:hypothetical protein